MSQTIGKNHWKVNIAFAIFSVFFFFYFLCSWFPSPFFSFSTLNQGLFHIFSILPYFTHFQYSIFPLQNEFWFARFSALFLILLVYKSFFWLWNPLDKWRSRILKWIEKKNIWEWQHENGSENYVFRLFCGAFFYFCDEKFPHVMNVSVNGF